MCSSAQRGRDAVALAGSETGTAHGRGGPYRVECRFSLRFCGFLIYVKATCRAPMCADPLCAHGSTTTSLGDMGGSLEFQRKLAFTPSDRLSPMCEPSSHSPPKGPENRSGRWRSGHLAGFEGRRGTIGPIGRGVCWAPCPPIGHSCGEPTRLLPGGLPANWDVDSESQQDSGQSARTRRLRKRLPALSVRSGPSARPGLSRPGTRRSQRPSGRSPGRGGIRGG